MGDVSGEPARQSNATVRDTHLDGMRGVAAFIVLITHTLAAFWPTTVYGPQRSGSTVDFLFLKTPLALMTNGHFAVCLFFILSGYVLTKKYFVSSTPSLQRLGPDIGKRFARLYVAALPAALAAAILMWGGLYYTHSAADFTHSRWLAESRSTCSPRDVGLVLLNPIMCLTDQYNPVAWSLFVELWGSIAAFCIVIVTSQLKPLGRLAACAAIVILSRLASLGNGDNVTYGYLGFFAIGVAFADFEPRILEAVEKVPRGRVWRAASTAGLIVLVMLLCAIPHYALFHGQPTLLPRYGAVALKLAVMGGPSGVLALVVFAIVLASRSAQSILSTSIPAFLGRISVGLYLVHMPILFSLGCWIVSHHHTFDMSLAWGRAFAAIAVIALSLVLGHVYSIVFDDRAVAISRRLGQLLTAK
jgi:peptidoglycan/LPS O-acetylase OafA/YrhL